MGAAPWKPEAHHALNQEEPPLGITIAAFTEDLLCASTVLITLHIPTPLVNPLKSTLLFPHFSDEEMGIAR